MSKATDHYSEWPRAIAGIKREAPDIGKAFGPFFHTLMSDGEMSGLQKEFCALAIGMALRCEHCVYSHAEKCVKLGATRAQLMELAGVVVMMQGGPGYVSVPQLIDALDSLGVE